MFCSWCKCFKGSQGSVEPEPECLMNSIRRQVESENQLTAFVLSDQSSRRNSHPNQLKFLEEYENAKKGIFVTPSITQLTHSSPPSPVMQYPVVPPGRLF